jgi:hypothetical protein
MKLWLISQNVNHNYDTYDSAVVAANTEEEARHTYPDNYGLSPCYWNGSKWLQHLNDGRVLNYSSWTWTTPEHVEVKFLADGYEGPAGTVCASFNAG